ncbi:MAG: Asparagine synthetase [glutamine-hydrolyzing] (EC [uncultured Sulfurovum sp.]|uniref:asparagine synthase (glutamine-hydrolyzing) n=1 Tax=uncultured Sulfurovum sp. TaxID=269237 RepID=A0A6S6TRF8_9BACT|nr:MAG: Asparagine synthetase [glutamine-hydrolyzing] (EC [uncultured Sulfurovum sp.]
MTHFLISIDKTDKNFKIIEHSDDIQIIDNHNILMLFDGNNSSNILEAYTLEGINFIKKIQGSFSLFLYDKIKNQFFIAKDKVGIKPLYYADTHETIIVGTHLKRFSKNTKFSPEINPSTLGEYLQFGFILQPNTIFKNAYKVCAGEYLTFNLKDYTYTKHKYWELESCYQEEKCLHNETEVLQQTDELLNSIIEKETKNAHYGLSLSGGYDSSTLTAIAQKQSATKVDTFTIGFFDENINEAHDAKEIATSLGTNHHEHYFTEDDAMKVISKMHEIFDEPFADYAAAPTIITSELLKQQGIQQLIVGDGGDEVFATAENVHGFERLQNTPKILKVIMAKTLNSIKLQHVPYLKNYKNLPIKQNKLYHLLMAQNIPQMIYGRNTLFLESELNLHVRGYKPLIVNSFDNINFNNPAETVDEVIGAYFKTTMVDGELVKSYSTMNHANIKLSTPFLDESLLNHMAKIPSSLKIKNGIKKYLLKEIAHQYIPKKLLDRPKSGFAIPFASWMQNNLKEILYLQINKKRLDKDNIFYTTSILNIRDQFYAGNEAYKYKLWRIFIFQLWYENFTNTQITKDKPSKSV